MSKLVGALVTNIDRDWAIQQCPDWCEIGNVERDDSGELVDDDRQLDAEGATPGKLGKPSWSQFVAEEIEKFERKYNGERKTFSDWSYLWRKEWWPRVEPRKRFPRSAPKGEFQPFFRRGTIEFERALKLAKPHERTAWLIAGVAQFKPDDKRLNKVRG